MTARRPVPLLPLMGIILLGPTAAAAEPVVLEQLVSRHDPNFDVARARLGVGRDGHVYLVSGGRTAGHALRAAADGKDRSGGTVGYAATAIAANPAGVVATSEAHFSHRLAVWDRRFTPVGQAADFLVNDKVQWNAPSDVAAGESGDFYGIDQHRLRVVRVGPDGRVATTYRLDQLGEKSPGGTVGLRVWEAGKRFVTAWAGGAVWASGFDGTPLWSVKLRPAGETPGGFDLDADGRLHVLPGGDEVKVFGPDGKPAGAVKLQAPPGSRPVTDLRVRGGEFVVKRADPAALFEVYDRATGGLVRRVPADVERLTATYPSAVWTAGQPVPFAVAFDAAGRPTKPQFRVWLRPLGVPEFAELAIADGTVTPPADARGLYQVRVSPDVRGRAAEYTVDGVVEIRTPGATGSVSIFTPLNRFYYGRGEPIPVTVLARAGGGQALPATLAVRLKRGTEVVHEHAVKLADGQGEVTLPADRTKELPPGRYVLDADAPGFTVAPQYLEVGPGLPTRPRFHLVQHGDYAHGFPPGPRPDPAHLPRFADLPDATADHLARTRALGINLFVDRLGQAGQGLLGHYRPTPADPALAERLRAADPAAVAPEKAVFEDPVRRAVAGYGAFGIEEQGILLLMDAGLPLGTLADPRKPEQMEKDLQAVTREFLPYPAFRGWSWAANWWLDRTGAAAAADTAEKAAYEAALKQAKETGAWAAVLDTVSDRSFAHAVGAEKRFRAALHAAAPGKCSVMTGPYRAILAHPPVIFRGADEVDLHYQAEQIQPPQVAPHHVDFYKRPGKPAWGHPELWNDDGTGGMIFPTLFQMAMRGADGVGKSGPVAGPMGTPDRDDPRSGGAGAVSAFRAAHDVFRRYGPLLAAAETADRVAIVVSTRMQRIETFDGKIGGAYFDSLFEAYNACLYAHRPASFVFAEDLTPDTLKRFKAVLVVAQWVELDPPLADAIKAAAAAGVRVFHDGGCRPELVKGFAPLGVTFDRVKQDPSAWQDDAAHHRFPGYFLEHAKGLRKVLGPVVPPVAGCDQPEVMLTERRTGDVRYVWAVNNTMLGWDPGLAWRVSLILSHRVPVVAKLKLDVPAGHRVFDLFAGKDAPHDGGTVTADLRTMPARVFAVLPPGKELPADADPADGRFGPHVRDIAVSADGRAAVLSCFNWDHNLYGLDPDTGETRWRNKLGHSFAYAPAALPGGFAVRGFDVSTAEGHHLYLTGPDGKPERRFALFGLPGRGTNWASAEWAQGPGADSFAAAPDGSWVAAAGGLGLVVWDRAGKELWADEWWKTDRKRVRLVALDDATLVTLDGGTATARSARDGKPAWSLTLADSGALSGGVVSGDRSTLVLRSDALGGRLFVVRGGKTVNDIPARAGDLAVSADGSLVVATDGRLLKAFDAAGGLLWTYTGDDALRRPRVSPDGSRVAVGSELGTLAVLTWDGAVVAEKDLGALPVPAWLPGGDLLAATWMGTVVRFDSALNPKWRRTLAPTETDARSKLLARDTTPTTRKAGWGNAGRTLPLTPNLLAGGQVLVTAGYDPPGPGGPLAWQNPVALLTDGKPAPPPKPWLDWGAVGYVDSGWQGRLAVQVDTFRTQLRVTGVTVVEDRAHPESWLRDARLQWWDAAAESWRDGPRLLADAAAHSHTFDKPVEAAKFRLVSAGREVWPAGNLRLGELVFHGQPLGASHPDAAARKPAAVLFDEREAEVRNLVYPGRPFAVRYAGAHSGGKCLELSAAGDAVPAYVPPFGHALPNWDFEIAQRPRAGQYRYLQFAWKAASDKTTGISLVVGRAWPTGGVAVTVGEANWAEGVSAEHRVSGKPPAEWTTVRVDLWAVAKGKPPRIQALNLKSVGGGALFDRIVLGRTEADLPPAK